jgi:peptidoglycan-associated lipoprotein
MKLFLRLIFILLFAAVLNGCATKPDDAAQAGADDQAAQTQGVGDEGALGGELLGADGRPNVMRIHFAFDSSAIDDDNRETLEAHAAYLSANPGISLKLEGHCDERGTREYNLALGERRAQAVSRMLVVLGIDNSRLTTTSYGEEKPLEEGHNEAAWKMNRRVEIIY